MDVEPTPNGDGRFLGSDRRPSSAMESSPPFIALPLSVRGLLDRNGGSALSKIDSPALEVLSPRY